MAEVKMDMTEYEALKKVEALLEESKKEQKKLYEELDKIQKEKIQALNESAYQVLHRKIVTYKHFRLETVNKDLFRSFLVRWKDFDRHSHHRGLGPGSMHSEEYLCRAFFDILASTETAVSTSERDEQVTYKGLTEVKEEITAEVTLKIDKKCKEALAFQEANKDLAKLHKENETEIIPGLNKDLYELRGEHEKALETNSKLCDELSNYKYVISNIKGKISQSTFFNRKSVLSSIVVLISELKKKYDDKN